MESSSRMTHQSDIPGGEGSAASPADWRAVAEHIRRDWDPEWWPGETLDAMADEIDQLRGDVDRLREQQQARDVVPQNPAKGMLQDAVKADIARIPAHVRDENQGMVALALSLARAIDMGVGSPAPNAKELQNVLANLYALTPAEGGEDPVDEFTRKRQTRESKAAHPAFAGPDEHDAGD